MKKWTVVVEIVCSRQPSVRDMEQALRYFSIHRRNKAPYEGGTIKASLVSSKELTQKEKEKYG